MKGMVILTVYDDGPVAPQGTLSTKSSPTCRILPFAWKQQRALKGSVNEDRNGKVSVEQQQTDGKPCTALLGGKFVTRLEKRTPEPYYSVIP